MEIQDNRPNSEFEECKERPSMKASNFVDHDHEEFEYYRVNKFVDSIFDRLPRCLGWGLHDLIVDFKLWVKSAYQRIRYGVSDRECWGLYLTMARFNLKRLRYYKYMKRLSHPCGMTEDEWEKIIDESIWVFDYILNEEKYNPLNDISDNREQFNAWHERHKILEERKKKALLNFATYFEAFWD